MPAPSTTVSKFNLVMSLQLPFRREMP
jgi:hypothetical protein